LAAFFLADFLVGFFLGALFAARLALVLAPPDFRAAAFFFAGLRAACLRPRAFVVRPGAALRLAFFFAVLAVPDRFDFFAAFLRFAAIVPPSSVNRPLVQSRDGLACGVAASAMPRRPY
jgi:hypothetical protein